ncbi:hypothetical protein [Escherichia phage vB_EcoM_JNE01]|nr:hypothetical protein [Escherichia phage vB_EcoM_JNE01]
MSHSEWMYFMKQKYAPPLNESISYIHWNVIKNPSLYKRYFVEPNTGWFLMELIFRD